MSMQYQSIISNMKFHGHLAIICHMGGDEARWIGGAEGDPSGERFFYQSSQKYMEICDRNRHKMTDYAMQYQIGNIRDLIHELDLPSIPENTVQEIIRKFLDENGETDSKARLRWVFEKLAHYFSESQINLLEKEIRKRTALPEHLLMPFSTVTFGQSDNMSIILGDEFDYAGWILEEPEAPVKQTCVAFCPELGSMGIETGKKGSPFFEMEELMNSAIRDKNPKKNWARLPRFEGWEETPLVAVTYFRTSGLCNIGSGALWQEAILRESARRAKGKIDFLKKAEINSKYAKPDDAERFRCCFLWPIGWADFCMVSLASNFSTIISVVHDLRQMTFKNLFEVMKDAYGKNSLGEEVSLEALAREFAVHEGFVKIENQYRTEAKITQREESPQLLRHNHVFCSSTTTFGVEHHAFMNLEETGKGQWNGIVSADPRFNVSPGHLATLSRNEDLSKAYNLYENDLKVSQWFAAGQYDSSDKSCYAAEVRHSCTLTDLLKRIRLLRGEKHDSGNNRIMWPIQDLMTEIHVPLLLSEEADPEHPEHVNLHPLLAEIRKRVFLGEYDEGELSIFTLKKRIKDLGIPSPLSTVIVDLFADYARSLSDPFLYDNVLDLYDLFRAVYRALTNEMPDQMDSLMEMCKDNKELIASRKMAYMNENKAKEITAMVNLIENALHRRTQMGFRQAQRWQEALDMRGGFNRLVNAADVPLKCGFSILRRIMMGHVKEIYGKDDLLEPGDEENTKKRHAFRARLGGASKVAHNSTAIIRRFTLGHEKKNFIADLGLNIAHLTRPGFLVTHLHETGHLLNDLVRRDNKDGKYYRPEYCPDCMEKSCYRYRTMNRMSDWDIEIRERHEEIFSEMFTFGFLMHDSENSNIGRTYLRFYLGMFFLNERGMNVQSDITLRRYAEVAIRGFLAVHPWIVNRGGDKGQEKSYELGTDYSQYRKQAHTEFVEMMKDVGPMHYEFRRFWKGDNRKYIEDRFDQIYIETYRPLCCIWKDVVDIVRVICQPLSPNGDIGTNPNREDLEDLIAQIEQGYREGRPLLRFLYTYSDWNSLDEESRRKRHRALEKRKHLDSVFLMRQILRVHIEDIFKDIDIEKETCRSSCMNLNKGINRQMLDRGYNGLVSADYEKRREYLQRRASVLVTLWDISTAIRARIMRRILKAHFPEVT